MFILYDLIFLIFILIYFPLYLLRGKFQRGFLRRLGSLPADLNLEGPIWVHAVSVGETVAIKELILNLRRVYPRKKFVISTVTQTGNKIAQGLINKGDFLTYLPLDFSFIVKRVLKRIKPCMFIIAETEIWPNLISCLNQQKVPVFVVNGRISDSSYRGYRAIKVLIQPVLRSVSQFCVQSAIDAWRLQNLGVDQDNIQVTGNVKFDIDPANALSKNAALYRQRLMLRQDDQLLVCGSTHPGEEELIFNAYQEVLADLPKLKILIAPRHPERAKEVSRIAARKGFTPVFISNISEAQAGGNNAVFILDVIGELLNYYSVADIVFVGGSLVKKGGHNILEPASLKKPVIFGLNMSNFRDISKLFLENEAAIVVRDEHELAGKIKEMLIDDSLTRQLVQRAYELIFKYKGATERNVQVIQKIVMI